MTKRVIVFNSAKVLFLAILVTILTALIIKQGGTSTPVPETISEPRLESPWGIPDYNSDPVYDEVPVEKAQEFVDESKEAIINYDESYNIHYAQNAKAICTALDTGGHTLDDVFVEETPSKTIARAAVENYCPHNL